MREVLDFSCMLEVEFGYRILRFFGLGSEGEGGVKDIWLGPLGGTMGSDWEAWGRGP